MMVFTIGVRWPTRNSVLKYLFLAKKSILLLASPLLVFVADPEIGFTPTTFMFQDAFLIWMTQLIVAFIL